MSKTGSRAHNKKMPTKSSRPVPVASRVNRFSYAIRNIVAEAKAVEARGTSVRYLNIGDPVAFGFSTPAHLVEAASRAMRDGHNGYLASVGILEAREAVATDYTALTASSRFRCGWCCSCSRL